MYISTAKGQRSPNQFVPSVAYCELLAKLLECGDDWATWAVLTGLSFGVAPWYMSTYILNRLQGLAFLGKSLLCFVLFCCLYSAGESSRRRSGRRTSSGNL